MRNYRRLMNKNWIRTFALLIFVLPFNLPAQSRSELLGLYPGIALDINNTLEGRQFVVAIPPNEAEGVEIIQRAIEIYVTSRFDTEVTIEMPGLGFGPLTKRIKALEITTFSGEANELSWAMEVRKSEEIVDKAMIITSPDPITVWMMNAKRFSTEGFGLRPTNLWGEEYRHLGYYDYPEEEINRAGGFLVVAQEDDTKVSLEIGGSSSSGTTVGGRSAGDVLEFTLNRGQTYMVKGNGQDRTFDLSGTRIVGSKPIGVVSFHERCVIPVAMGTSSRDHISEMLPPVDAWGREHITLEFFSENTGDYFRILAQENNTSFVVRYYEKDGNRELIGIREGLLEKAGDWAEFDEVNPNGGATAIRGTGVWTSDKPTMLMQYAYSSGWVGNQDFDPMMTLVPPTDQYNLGASLLTTPSNAEFNTNWLQILAKGTEDPTQKLLREIILDGTPVADRDPLFVVNQIPETDYYWARVNVPPGAHQITGATPFGTYVYGFSRFESYAWTSSVSTSFLNTTDVLAPEVSETRTSPWVIDLEVTELRAEDSGIAAIELIRAESENVSINVLDDLQLGGKHTSAGALLLQNDLGTSAHAVVLLRDRAGNVSVHEFAFEAGNVAVSPDPLDFGIVRVGNSAARATDVTNLGNFALTLSALKVGPSKDYELLTPSLPASIAPGESLSLTIRYAPETVSDTFDLDAVSAKAELQFDGGFTTTFDVLGRGDVPRLRVITASFPTTEVGASNCQSPGIEVHNYGQLSADISAIDEIMAPFDLQGALPELPISLAPGASLVLEPLCFAPIAPGIFQQDITFTFDDPTIQPLVARLSARADQPSSVANKSIFDKKLTLSPNPASSSVTIDWSARTSADLALHIYDVRGVSVYTRNLGMQAPGKNHISLDVHELAVGSYFVVLQTEGVSFTQTLMINR